MDADRNIVVEAIRDAFRGVVLGDGVGLRQGQGLDDYAYEHELVELRRRDEKIDWEAIPAEDLNKCHSSLRFFDAEGMLFHLPAFMIAELNGSLDYDCVLFSLTKLNGIWRDLFALLTKSQKSAVCDFLHVLKDHPDYEFDKDRIGKSLQEFWEAP